MLVAVIGQGSIGRRHAANALALGHQAIVFDPAPAVQPPAGAERREGVAECLADADVAIVASPSSEHAAHARTAIERGVAVLVEKPLALDCASAAELDWLARERRVLLSVAMNLREHAGTRALASLLAEDAAGHVSHARAWCGSWLPGWHPGSDYRASYSARAELGGGVLLDVAVHELDYLLWLLGPARAVSALAGRTALEIDVEDVAAIALELESGTIAEVSVDYLDRCYARGCRIVGSERTLSWSWRRERVCVYSLDGEVSSAHVPNDLDATYRAELERFLDAAGSGAPAPVPAADALRVLAVTDAARRAASEGRRIWLAPAIELREARREDAELLLAWRNDPETRRQSRNSSEIGPGEHSSWLERALAQSTTQLWMAECEGRPLAHVRVGPRQDRTAEIHVVVAPRARGRGVGVAALTQAAARALADPGVTTLHAHVKPENKASLHSFARAGFHSAGADRDGLLRLERQAAGNRDARLHPERYARATAI